MENIKDAGSKGYCILYLLMFLFFFFAWGVTLCNWGHILEFPK